MRIGVIDGRAVVIRGDRAADLEKASAGRFSSDVMAAYGAFDEIRSLAEGLADDAFVGFETAALQNPVPAAKQVFGIGANYVDHLAEASADLPAEPLVFTKFPSCIVGPGEPIMLPTRKVDWEAEIVAVVGRGGSHIAAADAWQHLAGLTIGQDISERPLQLRGKHPQFSLGKSYTTFGPIGPVVVSVDELANRDDVQIGCRLGDETMQHSSTASLIFSIPFLVEYLSAICPLLPGDLIFTGTPSGVGMFRTPRRFLQPGDVVSTYSEGIGELVNPVVAGPGYPVN